MPRKLGRLALLAVLVLGTGAHVPAQFHDFVRRDKDRLFDGDRELRFISFNIPNLHYLEDYLPITGTNPWRLPDEFEIRDALTAIKQVGGSVARMYTLSVRRSDDLRGILRHVEGPGKFNKDAFRALDKVLQVANEVGVRVIIPFVDNWKWWGGVAEYAAFRGKGREEFWTDSELIADFKKTVAFLIDRKNTYTGTTYKDDKAEGEWKIPIGPLLPTKWMTAGISIVRSSAMKVPFRVIPIIIEFGPGTNPGFRNTLIPPARLQFLKRSLVNELESRVLCRRVLFCNS